MASPVSTDLFGSNAKMEMWDHDPGGTSATIVTPDGGTTDRIFDMKEFDQFVCAAMSSTLTGNGITKLEIVASDSADMSTNLTVIKDSGTVAADAVGDWVMEECTAAELAQLSSDNSYSPGLRYVAGRLTMQNSADEAVVVYIGLCPRFAYDGLTPDTTIA